MYELTEKRFIDFFREADETGMGYCVVTAYLKDGREFRQVIWDSGNITQVRGYKEIPFKEADIDHFIVTHEKWDWRNRGGDV